jgi:hypothetical protein
MLVGCARQQPATTATSSPEGRWLLLTFDGSLKVAYGGRPVLCREGTFSGRPLAATPDGRRSFVELSDNEFRFDFLFDHQGSMETMTNGPGAAESFHLHWYTDLANTHAERVWRRESGELHGLVSLEVEDPDSDEIATLVLRVEGTLMGPREMRGTWSYSEETAFAGCSSRGSGAGTWTAVPELPSEVSAAPP